MTARGKPVADEKEVLSFVTAVMRGEEPDGRMSDRLKAADMLGKRYRLFSESESTGGEKVVILDDVTGER